MFRERGDKLIDAEHGRGARHGGDDPHGGFAGWPRRLGRAGSHRRHRLAGLGPRLSERFFAIGDRRSAQLDSGVAPRIDAPIRIADPLAGDAQSGHERDPCDRRLINFPMVAADPAERTGRAVAGCSSGRQRQPCAGVCQKPREAFLKPPSQS